MGRHRQIDGGLPLVLLCDVEMHIGRRAARLGDLGCDGFTLLVEHIGDHHGPGALAGKQAGGRRAHAARRAGHQGHFVLHSHG